MNLSSQSTSLYYRTVLMSQDEQLWGWGRPTLLLIADIDEIGAFTYPIIFQPTLVPLSNLPCAPLDIKQVSFSFNHALLLTRNGKVYAWGKNNKGQLGTAYPEHNSMPLLVEVPGNPKIVSVATGEYTSFLISDEGHVYFFGYSYNKSTHVPTKIPQLSEIVKLASCRHTIALTKSGKAWGWGDNDSGQVGLGHVTHVREPVEISLPEEISEIFVSGDYSVFLTKNGHIYTCGSNSCGQLGVGDRETEGLFSPSLLPLEEVISVACGWDHCLALNQDGSLLSWGDNAYHQLGLFAGDDPESAELTEHPRCVLTPTPVNFRFPEPVVWLGSGLYESMAMTKDGSLYTWGANQSLVDKTNNLGQGVLDNRFLKMPTLVQGVKFQHPLIFTFFWEHVVFWVALGRLDKGSEFFRLPDEVLYNFVGVL
jgi:alpha-tubulin suppressor-like RCC1 family protein